MDIIDTIKDQIENNNILLYMKGSPNQPQCGFSARTVQALMACGERFAYVDILSNPEIRANLPKSANWPTFPQLWVDGELIGGCDIVTEMTLSGELDQLFDQCENFIHMLSCTRFKIRTQYAKTVYILMHGIDESPGQILNAFIILDRPGNYFVIDIGNIADIGDLIASAAEIARDQVKYNHYPGMTDVAEIIDRHSTDVDTYLTGDDWCKWLLLSSQTIINFKHNKVIWGFRNYC